MCERVYTYFACGAWDTMDHRCPGEKMDELRPCGHCMAKNKSICCDKANEFDQRILDLRAQCEDYREVLNKISSWKETPGKMSDGSLNYSGFDEPASASLAREVLSKHEGK